MSNFEVFSGNERNLWEGINLVCTLLVIHALKLNCRCQTALCILYGFNDVGQSQNSFRSTVASLSKITTLFFWSHLQWQFYMILGDWSKLNNGSVIHGFLNVQTVMIISSLDNFHNKEIHVVHVSTTKQ